MVHLAQVGGGHQEPAAGMWVSSSASAMLMAGLAKCAMLMAGHMHTWDVEFWNQKIIIIMTPGTRARSDWAPGKLQ